MIKILIIHHDLNKAKEIEHFIMNCYVECNIRLVVTTNKHEIIEMLDHNLGQIDLCFTEVKLNGFSMFGLVRNIRKQNPDMKIISISDTEEYALDAWQSGINDYLLEPITLEKIQNSIKNLHI